MKKIFKATLDLGSSMFENQLLNLNIYAVFNEQTSGSNINIVNNSNNNSGVVDRRMTPKLGATQPTLSMESTNSGSGVGNVKRRQLPQIPFEKQKESRDKSKIIIYSFFL